MNKISIIIPVYNAENSIEPLLRSLEKQSISKEYLQIIIVDNHSTDGTLEVIDKYLDILPITVAPEFQQQSSYAARNTGIKRASGEVLCFIDSDCIPHKDWLKEGVKYLQRFPDRYLVAGRVKWKFQDTSNIIEIYDSIMHLDQGYYVSIGGAVTANLFVRKEVIEKVGGFEYRTVSGGDFEFCKRAQKQGFKLYYNNNAVVYHPTIRVLDRLLKKALRFGAGEAQLWRIGKTKKLYFANPLSYIPGPAFFYRVYKHKMQKRLSLLICLFLLESFTRAASNLCEFLKLTIFEVGSLG